LSLRPLLGLLTLLALAGCARPPTDVQIRQTLQDMAQAVADGDVGVFMAPLADDFTADTWQLDRRGARLLLIRETRARERIQVRLIDIEIEPVSADRAHARFHAVLTGGSGLVPDEGGWYRVTTGWRRDGADWALINASWDRVVGR
jgi:ketosteroid isomerase-like protein